jgi:glutamine phosphoribosylpyrophosphate amidotransferase
MVTTNWKKFQEHKANGLVKDVFVKQSLLDTLHGGWVLGSKEVPVCQFICVCVWSSPC